MGIVQSLKKRFWILILCLILLISLVVNGLFLLDNNPVSSRTLSKAAKVIGLQFTKSERKLMKEDVQENLLELSPVRLNYGQVLLDSCGHAYVPVADFLLQEAQDLLDQKLQVDILCLRIHPLGKTEQPVRNGAAAIHG